MSERDDAYEERIAHLRTGIKMLGEELNAMRARIGVPEGRAYQTLLDKDMDRAMAMDFLFDDGDRLRDRGDPPRQFPEQMEAGPPMLVDRHAIHAPDGRLLWVATVPAGTPIKIPPDPSLTVRESRMSSVFGVEVETQTDGSERNE